MVPKTMCTHCYIYIYIQYASKAFNNVSEYFRRRLFKPKLRWVNGDIIFIITDLSDISLADDWHIADDVRKNEAIFSELSLC